MLNFKVEEIHQVIVISLYGLLTRDTIREAEEVWNDAVDKRPEAIALDLNELQQVDSVAINHLFKLSRKSKESDVDLVIYNVGKPINDIFEVIKLNKVISFMSREQFENKYIKGSI